MSIPKFNGHENHFNAVAKEYPQNTVETPIETPEQTPEVPNNNNENTTPVAPPTDTTPTTNSNEDSISQFRNDYRIILNAKVLKELEAFDGERKKNLYLAIVCASLMCLLGVGILFWHIFLNNSSSGGRGIGKLVAACFGGAFCIWHCIKKKFEKKIKDKAMPTLMNAFRNFYWQRNSSISDEEICATHILNKGYEFTKFDDCFAGKYKDVPIHISECEYTYDKNKSFEGAIVRIKMNKEFEGLTVIRPKKDAYPKEFKKLKMEEVKLEDIEYLKNHLTFSTDQIESRYLITTAFIDRFKRMSETFQAKGSYCAFYKDSVYFGFHTGRDLFSLGSLVKPVTDVTQFEIMLEEIVSILELIDLYKLDKKLGL